MNHTMEGGMEFPAFPYPQPYSIQLQLMRFLYQALCEGGVAIVESPTGTGKTLSLICSVLQWLEDQRDGKPDTCDLKLHNEKEDSSDEPDWMKDFTEKKELVGKEKRVNSHLKKDRCKVSTKVHQVTFGGESEERARLKGHVNNSSENLELDDIFLIEDYDSDSSSLGGAVKRKPIESLSSSSDDPDDNDCVEGENVDEKAPKVFFASRTHSQLSQFIIELKRTPFASTLEVVALGSRKALCINPEVLRHRSVARINEHCIDMQKSKTRKVMIEPKKRVRKKAHGRCPYLKSKKSQRKFKEEVHAEPMDIEDLVVVGKKLGTCPYYGSRQMIPSADVVVLPYQSLLHSATRTFLGITLKDSIVIFDEAHNLVDTVSNIYSCQVSSAQLRLVQSQLLEYLERFRSRLAAGNRRYIQTILVLLEGFLRHSSLNDQTCSELDQCSNDGGTAENAKIMKINDFLFSLEIDNINLFKLSQYIKETNIVHKVSSYAERCIFQQAVGPQQAHAQCDYQGTSAVSGFRSLADFIFSLTNADIDGRVLVTRAHSAECSETVFKFVMLNAAKHFSEVLSEARSVVLAGGTLSPLEELKERSQQNKSETKFKDTFLNIQIEELGRLIVNVSSIVPEGIVMFFPSFEYENQVHKIWESTGISASIEKKKAIFREPRNASAVETILLEYKEAIFNCSSVPKASSKQGALLLAVVGGKMSEGINFSDGMGRCVVMVGLPYPSPSDPELIERMRYIEGLGANSCPTDTCSVQHPSLQHFGPRGREYYENLCMKAVNQSIGRAIRHIGDYAAILLVDIRYVSGAKSRRDLAGPISKLPGWIKDRLVAIHGGFGEVPRLLHQFFKYNRSRHK